MIHAGLSTVNPVTHTRTTVLEANAETQGAGWLLELHSPPKAAPELPEHIHFNLTETFEMLAGQASYVLDGVAHTTQAGETFVFPARVRHLHPWNTGDTELVYRQRGQYDQPNLQMVEDILGLRPTQAGLARDGKNTGGLASGLQRIVTAKLLARWGTSLTRPPLPVQKVLFATVGALAEALGYRAVHLEYLE